MAEKLAAGSKKAEGIHPEVLKSLVSQCDGMKADMDEARGELGAAVKNAEETHGVNRRAFKLVLSLKRMEQSQRDDFLRSLNDYVEKLDLAPQGDLFADDQTGERGDPDAAAVAKNTKALKGVKQLEPGVH